MAVFRKVKKTDYTIIDNNIFKNQKLSLKGKGMICTMLSLPDNWNFSEEGLTQLSNDSRAGIRSTLKELMEYGYLTRERNRDEKGKLRETIYTIYEDPMYQKLTLDKPMLVKKHNKELSNKELNNKVNDDDNIIDFLQKNGFVLNDILYDVVKEWEDTELTRYAIKKAVLNNKYNINYIQKILYSYEKNNIKTVQEAIEQDEEFNNKKEFYYKNKYQVKESRYEREQRLLREMCEDEQN